MSTEIVLEHWDPDSDGPLTEANMRSMLERLGYEVSRYVYPPDTCFAPHRHSVDKIDAVLSGQFRMGMYGRKVVLAAGDWLVVPRGVLHEAEVLGDDPVVSLDAVRTR